MALEISLHYCCRVDRHSERSLSSLLVCFEGKYLERIRDYRFLDDVGESAT